MVEFRKVYHLLDPTESLSTAVTKMVKIALIHMLGVNLSRVHGIRFYTLTVFIGLSFKMHISPHSSVAFVVKHTLT